MHIRLEYVRCEQMIYLSHLDLMRTFGRAMRRGGVPIAYSAGFNPHAQMVFGLPLQVGMAGKAEYLDIETEGSDNACDAMDKLNRVFPEGLYITAARERKTKENIMSIITHASYEMRVGYRAAEITARCDEQINVRDETLNIGQADGQADARGGRGWRGGRGDAVAYLANAVEAFLLPGARIVEKKRNSRSGRDKQERGYGNGGGRNKSLPAKTMDLAPLVRYIEARDDVLAMTVTAGSVNNVSPDLVLSALNAIAKDNRIGDVNSEFVKISLCRKALYVERGGVLYSPIDDAICG